MRCRIAVTKVAQPPNRPKRVAQHNVLLVSVDGRCHTESRFSLVYFAFLLGKRVICQQFYRRLTDMLGDVTAVFPGRQGRKSDDMCVLSSPANHGLDSSTAPQKIRHNVFKSDVSGANLLTTRLTVRWNRHARLTSEPSVLHHVITTAEKGVR